MQISKNLTRAEFERAKFYDLCEKTMDRVAKFLKKFFPKERDSLEDIIAKVLARDFSGLDVKKLKGEESKFRVRKGRIRVIFKKTGDDIFILSVERRSDTTYK